VGADGGGVSEGGVRRPGDVSAAGIDRTCKICINVDARIECKEQKTIEIHASLFERHTPRLAVIDPIARVGNRSISFPSSSRR